MKIIKVTVNQMDEIIIRFMEGRKKGNDRDHRRYEIYKKTVKQEGEEAFRFVFGG